MTVWHVPGKEHCQVLGKKQKAWGGGHCQVELSVFQQRRTPNLLPHYVVTARIQLLGEHISTTKEHSSVVFLLSIDSLSPHPELRIIF